MKNEIQWRNQNGRKSTRIEDTNQIEQKKKELCSNKQQNTKKKQKKEEQRKRKTPEKITKTRKKK